MLKSDMETLVAGAVILMASVCLPACKGAGGAAVGGGGGGGSEVAETSPGPGNDEDGAGGLRNLSQLPDPSQIMQSQAVQSESLAGILAVGGEPPVFSSLNSESVDQYFWNGLVAKILKAGKATREQADEFWGQLERGAAGNGGCYMAQSVAENVGRVQQAGNSQCYMKGLAALESGVKVVSGNISQAKLFDQVSGDKRVRVRVMNHPKREGEGGPEGDFDVNIRILGHGGDKDAAYRVELFGCHDGTPDNLEQIEMDRKTGLYSISSGDNYTDRDGNRSSGRSRLVAYLNVAADGTATFDSSRERLLSSRWQSANGLYKGETVITPDNLIYAKRYSSSNNRDWQGVDRNYTIASFSGSRISDVRLLEGAFKGVSTDSSDRTYGYSGGAEYNETYYGQKREGALYEAANTFDFESDEFFKELDAPDLDLSALDCGTEADAVVEMDFSDASVIALGEQCEQDHINYDLCNGDDLRRAQQLAMEASW